MSSQFENHWQSRTKLLLGEEKLNRLNQAHVLVIGLGGVGATATEQLVRAGIGELTIADSDQVSLSNINRQLPALHSTIGMNKTEVIANRLKDINPDLRLNIVNTYLKDEILTDLVSKPYDYIVDAIDTLSPKVFLLFHAMNNKQRLVSAMGAGAKLDPTKIHIADIADTHTCNLAIHVRKRLRKLNITSGFKAVYSSEKVIKEALIYVENEQNKKTNVGTISYMPAIFGNFCASVVVNDLIKE